MADHRFLLTKIFSDKTLNFDWNLFWPKIYFWPKIFELKIIFDQIFFLLKNFLFSEYPFDQYFHLIKNFILPHFFDQKQLLSKIFSPKIVILATTKWIKSSVEFDISASLACYNSNDTFINISVLKQYYNFHMILQYKLFAYQKVSLNHPDRCEPALWFFHYIIPQEWPLTTK